MKNHKLNAGQSGKVRNPNSKKILCLCRGGASRSVAMANTLKYNAGHDALCAGFEGNDKETLEMLFKWAEIIVVMRDFFINEIPNEYHYKVRTCEVGEDSYFNPNEELYSKCTNWIKTQEDIKLGHLLKN